MFIHSRLLYTLQKAILSLILSTLLLPLTSYAEPYLAVKTRNKCSACHINPTGGGARTVFGSIYGSQILARNSHSLPGDADPGKITNYLRMGGDLRFNFDYSDSDANDSQSFGTDAAQIYLALQPENFPIAFYLDQQVAPGSTLNREAFILARIQVAQIPGQHYLKAGTFILPYGLRLQDDTAFVRQASQINFNSNDNGLELGLEFAHTTINAAISNGTNNAVSNDDEAFAYTLRAEYLRSFWRIGASALFNDADVGQRTLYGLFAGLNFGRFSFLAEIDRIEDESIQNIANENQVQIASFLEANVELSKGYNLKLTTEYLDPDDNIDENERARNSLLLEYTPLPYFQVRSGVRSGDDIPQRDVGNFTEAFLQMHMYF